MLTESQMTLRYLLAGSLRRDFILTPNGSMHLDIPGGSLFYSACGLGLWDKGAGLVGRSGQEFPKEWLQHFIDCGFDIRGIRVLNESMDQRSFKVYPDADTCLEDNPVNHFLRRSIPLPKALIGYNPPSPSPDNRRQPTNFTIRITDLPIDYLDCTAAHVCPMDYISHLALTERLRQGLINTLTLDPSAGYMDATYLGAIPSMVKGLTAFLCNQEKLEKLFSWHSTDPWDMAEEIASYGCEIVVIKRGALGQYVYDHAGHHRWSVPAYPTRVIDPTGAGDVFCGAFLAGYRLSYDPLQACLLGNIAASLSVEGSGPFFLLNVLPGLQQMRLEAIKDRVTKV